jgi:hypothetical protein
MPVTKRLITKDNPFVTGRFTAFEGDSLHSRVSLVVWLVDEFTSRLPLGEVTVHLKESKKKPIRNPSGYYCFTDLDDGSYIIVVTPDSILRDSYFQQEVQVKVPMPDALEPVERIALKPKISYPFPSYTTLIRGFVAKTVNGKADPVPNIPVYRLKADNTKGVETTTDRNGEYALYFKKVEKKNPSDVGMEVIIEADNNGQKKQEGLGIMQGGEGSTFRLDIVFTV